MSEFLTDERARIGYTLQVHGGTVKRVWCKVNISWFPKDERAKTGRTLQAQGHTVMRV